MGKQHLNYFHPFEHLAEGSEDQLTRAALALMRLVPLAHVELLRRVDAGRGLSDVPNGEFDTQTYHLHPELESAIEAGTVEDGVGPRVMRITATLNWKCSNPIAEPGSTASSAMETNSSS